MNTLPIAKKIQAKYLRAVNNEMIGNYQHSIVVHIMRRIVKLVFETPDFAIDLPIEPRWRDYYTTALQISAYLSYVQYEIIADDTIAHISLTDRYRAQILAAAPPSAPAVATPTPTPPPITDNAAPTPTPAECSECSEATSDAATDNAALSECSDSTTATATDNATPAEPSALSECSECSECSEPPTTPPPAPTESATNNAAPSECSECSASARVAANSRLKAVTTASLEGSLCNSRGQGRPGRPQPSDSQQQRIKSERRHLAPQNPSQFPKNHQFTPPTTPPPAPSECSECSASARVAANSRLKAVTTASLTGSLCISRGQGRPGRPQPSDSQQQRIKSERRHLAPQNPSQFPKNHQFTPSTALPQPHPPRPPTTRLSAALI